MTNETASRVDLLNKIDELEKRIAELESDASYPDSETHMANALDQAKNEVAQFISIASHDLREPLRLISNYLSLLEVEFADKLSPDASHYIEIATDNANRMQSLIESLLEYSKIGQQVTFQRVQLKHVVAQCLFNLRLKIDETQAEITTDELPLLIVSESHMVQLFQNLLENAIKFKGSHTPKIHIGAENKGDYWLFWMEDNGIGIKEEYLEQIFTMFQRLHSTHEYPGTGIGLTLCQRIVEQYGGKIWVESVLKEGSTFYWTLPILHRIN